MKLNWNFLGGRGVKNKKPSMGGVWIFSGTAPLQYSNYPSQKITLRKYTYFTQFNVRDGMIFKTSLSSRGEGNLKQLCSLISDTF